MGFFSFFSRRAAEEFVSKCPVRERESVIRVISKRGPDFFKESDFYVNADAEHA